MQPEAADAALLWDMIEGARKVRSFVVGLDAIAYASDAKTQSAVERQLEIVGEAAGRVSEGFRAAHPEIPWRQIIGQRHVLAHDYGVIDHERIWIVVRERIPELIALLGPLIPQSPPKK